MKRERMGTNNLQDFLIIAIEGSDAEENVMFYPLGKRLLTNQFYLENERNTYVIHWMRTTQ